MQTRRRGLSLLVSLFAISLTQFFAAQPVAAAGDLRYRRVCVASLEAPGETMRIRVSVSGPNGMISPGENWAIGNDYVEVSVGAAVPAQIYNQTLKDGDSESSTKSCCLAYP